MAYDFALSAKNHDIIIQDGDFLLIDNAERVAQQIKIVLWTWLGEWFLDSRKGVDYRGYILVKNPNLNHCKTILENAIIGVDGVNNVSVSLDYDSKERTLTASYSADTDYGVVKNLEVLGY